MKKFLAGLFSALVCGIVVMCASCKGSCNDDGEQKKPEVIKDGIALVLTEGESQSIDLTEYISIEGTDFVYEVESSDNGIATATCNGNTATVTAVSKGSATVTASADEASVSFAVTVKEEQQQQPEVKPAPEFKDVNIEYDLKDVNSKSVTLTPVSGSSSFSYTFALEEQDNYVAIDGNRLTVSYEETVEKQLTLVANYTDSENASAGEKSVQFKLNIKVTDTREQPDPTAKYKVLNGSFDSGLDGWIMDGEIGEITEQGTFWEQNFPIFNEGKYFSGSNHENAKGTLMSSAFEVGGVNKISFRLGSAGNSECYITLEKADGTVLEIWRNTKFADVGEWEAEEIGKTQFACNLVTYVADLTAYAGETLKIVLHDNADSGFGFFNFDELVTYYATQDEVPAGEIAVNQIADKTALKAVVDGALTSQGDYTEESYNAYTEKVSQAQAILDKFSATQAEVDSAKADVENAYEGLTVRTPEEVDGAVKTLIIVTGLSKELTISDYIDAKNLSEMTYEVSSGNELVTVGEIDGGKFTVTAGETEEDADVTVTVTAKYKGESKLTVTITLQVKCELQPVTKKPQVTNSVDIYTLENKNELTIDFTQNIESNGIDNLAYSVTTEGGTVTLDANNCLTYNLDGSYDQTAEEVVFNVAVGYGNDKSISYTYTLKISDTTAYRVANGNFDSGLDGWTMDGEIGEITEQGTFWEQNLPIFNDGKYFSGNDKENGKGTLTSSEFKVGGVNKISFRLGSAGNSECYITLEKADGTVLAIWRNTKFADVGNWDKDEIGKTQFACNLVTYVADLTVYEGETLKIVLHDNAESGFGFFNFDDLVTYYATQDEVPAGEVAVNQLADKTELKAVVDGALTSQGDYTEESYTAYTEKVTHAQAILDKLSATQTEVDSAKAEVENAYAGLTVRTPEEKADAEKSFRLLAGHSKELTISDFVDGKNLSNLTYEAVSADGNITVSAIADGKFTVTAGNEEVSGTISIVVKYKGESVLTVEIAVTVTTETAPALKHEAVEENIDLYTQSNKQSITLDFAHNVENVGELDLTYSVKSGGEALTLDGTSYTYTYSSYTETASVVVFEVKVSYTHNGNPAELNYNYTLNIKDTSAYRITNGGFDSGLDGWILSNSDLGGVNNNETYWNENIPFNNDGNFFNAYFFDGEGRENAMGTLTSSPFVIGGSGWITYKLGGAKIADKVYLDIIEKDTGIILARYYNNAFSDDGQSTEVRGCTLVAYKADLSAHIGKTVYIRLSDNGVRDYGLFFVDSFATYYPEAPDDGNVAVAVANRPENIYQVLNGGFETGDLTGWELVDGEVPGKVSNLTGYWGDNHSYNKDGDWLFTGAEGQSFETDPNLEYRIGTLRSSVFTLKAGGWISFKLGGATNDATNIRVVKADGTVLAVFNNSNPAELTGSMVQYVYQFADLAEDTECYIEICDNAENDWGLIVADSFTTDYTEAPALDGAVTATNKNS